MSREDCWDCGGEGALNLHDTDPLWYPDDYSEPCDTCHSRGGWWVCLSSPDWCEDHPRPGHEGVKRHTPETFTVPA